MTYRSVLAIGKTSFLCRAFLESCTFPIEAIGWREALLPGALTGADCVINFAIDPYYRTHLVDDSNDFDVQLAFQVKQTDAHYVMLSSRAAYKADSQWMSSESSPLGGINLYGINKARTERRLLSTLGEKRLTILRCGNIVGPEWSPATARISFMGLMMHSLRMHGCIEFDVSPFVRKDFVTAPYFANAVNTILRRIPSGIVNVGSGNPVKIGRLAMWLIEGFGSGQLIVHSPWVHDEFVLNVERLSKIMESTENRDELAAYCIDLGKALSKKQI